WSRFQVDYRIADGTWVPIEARGALAGTAKFRIVQPGPLTVRIQAYDLAGNRTEVTKDVSTPANIVGSSPNSTNTQQTAMRVSVPPEVPPGGIGTPGDPPGSVFLPPVDPPLGGRPTDKAPMGGFVPPPESLPKADPVAVSSTNTIAPSGVALPAAQ